MSKIIPTLRLNVALASDPASNPDAKEILSINVKSENYKHADDDDEVDLISQNEDAETLLDSVNISKIVLNEQQHNLAVPKTKENADSVNNLMVKNFDQMRPNCFMCTPCGIRFSSLSTLEAHATYYCTHRKTGENSLKTANSEVNGIEPPAKAMKTGKQYACSQCSYSADKKVSLNRHMRMHQTSPAPSSTTSNGDETPSQIVVPQLIAPVAQPVIVDRYCSDCDIRFSSTKTYRAHKQHYCSSRHQS
jgi:zinc finger protein ZFPM1